MLPPEYAARLFAAQEAGVPEAELRAILAEGLAQMYFRANNTRAHGLGVEFSDIELWRRRQTTDKGCPCTLLPRSTTRPGWSGMRETR
ncbi:hypothetical protein ABZ915_39470 [Streptomyces sp. NPDC046915]|uniref:hypothetical protein n=1 Tax=Streptomyces sp. NPDC046915 TaxID=3155257 RepID=UPI0033FAB3C9